MSIRSTDIPKEIYSVLKGAMDAKLSFIIWQRNIDHIIQFQVKAPKLRNILGKELLNFEVPESLDLLPELPVYFAISDSTVVFKSLDVSDAEQTLYVKRPSEVKYRDRRMSSRQTFNYQERMLVEIKFIERDTKGVSSISVIAQLVDVSNGGACVLLSKETVAQIDLDFSIHINSLSEQVKIDHEVANVVNARPKKHPLTNDAMIAIGISFLNA